MQIMILSINQIKAILESMANDREVKPELIEAFFSRFLIKKPLPVAKQASNYFVVRASLNDYDKGEVFTNISRCSYNPNIENIKLQRCNYEHQQVFYAAIPTNGKQVTASMTALLETSISLVKNKEINRRYFTLSRWRFNRDINVVVLPFTKRSIRKSIAFRELNSLFDKNLKELCNDDIFLYRYFKDFLEYISEIFCRTKDREKAYKISSAFFNAVLSFEYFFTENKSKSKYSIDGIIFPSANTKAEGMNIAFKKSLIDDGLLTCDLVIMYSMLRKSNNDKVIFFNDASKEQEPDENGNFKFNAIW